MRKYNYFDDEPEEFDSKSKFGGKINLSEINFNDIFKSVKSFFEDIIHGETLNNIKDIIELSYLKNAVLKLGAAVLFILFLVIFIFSFSHSINSQNKKSGVFYADAGKVCTDRITEYGSIKWEPMDSEKYGKNMARLTGFCYARQMDFNNDGKDELMLVYNNKNVYTLEVWGYVKKEFTKIYSREANSTNDDRDGSWIGLYHKNNKYYICVSEKNEPEKVTLYALKGKEFEKYSQCDYDYKNNIYSIKNKINAQDFETIKLSVIKSSLAEQITDIVTENIDSFGNVSAVSIANQKTAAQIKAEAYYQIVENRNDKYGKAKTATENGKAFIDGVALVRLIDFNNDGNEELLLVYRKNVKKSVTNSRTNQHIIIEEPIYCIEVYNWNGMVAKKIFSKDCVSNLMKDNDTNFVMLRKTNEGFDICINSYTYKNDNNYTASSRIYRMNGGEDIESVFSAKVENDYGYKQYYIDNEYTYRSTFESKAYEVPMFLDDEGSCGDEYSLTYISGNGSEKFNTVINDTVKTIESLNKNYTAE